MVQITPLEDADLSEDAVQKLLVALKAAPPPVTRTYLPTALPLAFPTPLHLLNVLTNMHLITAIFTQPSHAAYFAETRTDPKDTAIMGVMGLYLSSTEEWTADNLLSTAAWKAGKVSELLISEVFRIETMKEEEHETLKGVRVGGRWDPGAKLVEDLARFIKDTSADLGSAECAGQVVKVIVEEAWAEGEDQEVFVKNVCQQVSTRRVDERSRPSSLTAARCWLTGIKSKGMPLPFAPLQLIHSLATRQQDSKDLDLQLPPPGVVETISPLPLSIPTLLASGVLVPPAEQTQLAAAVSKYKDSSSHPGTVSAQVSEVTYDEFKSQSVQASVALHKADPSLSYFDTYLASYSLNSEKEKAGDQLYIIPS